MKKKFLATIASVLVLSFGLTPTVLDKNINTVKADYDITNNKAEQAKYNKYLGFAANIYHQIRFHDQALRLITPAGEDKTFTYTKPISSFVDIHGNTISVPENYTKIPAEIYPGQQYDPGVVYLLFWDGKDKTKVKADVYVNPNSNDYIRSEIWSMNDMRGVAYDNIGFDLKNKLNNLSPAPVSNNQHNKKNNPEKIKKQLPKTSAVR